ncbi:MAG TPA: hypothetical protein PKH79_03100 [Prolixibacteraceae bacterium]|nr:hypothetical protein [Prolixibacteraceae bacterium]
MKGKTNIHLWVISLIFFVFSVSPAKAQREVQDSRSSNRLQFLKNSLEREKAQTQFWWYGWLGLYSAATITQGAIYFSSDKKSVRQDMALGAATSFLGAAGQVISPLIPNKKLKEFESLPESTTMEQQKKLELAEKLLLEYKEKETSSRNWQNHLLTSSVNVASGLVTWLGFKRSFKDGLVNFAINEAVTEIQIFTSPTLAKRNYKKYCREYLNQDSGLSYKPGTCWYLAASPEGLGIKVVF